MQPTFMMYIETPPRPMNQTTSIIFLSLSICYLASTIFYGLDFTDSFYFILNTQNPTSYPLRFLTGLLGSYWADLFGNTVLSYRVLYLAFNILSVLIPVFLFQKYVNNSTLFSYAGLSILLLAPVSYNIYGSDVITQVLLSSLVSVFIKYLWESRTVHLLFIIIISALLTLSRIPNIIVIPLIIFGHIMHTLLFNQHGRSKYDFMASFKFILLLIISYLLLLAIITLFYFKSPTEYFLAITTHKMLLYGMPDRIINYLYVYAKDSISILQNMGFLFLIYYLHINVEKYFKANKLIGFGVTLLVYLYYLIVEISSSSYNLDLSLFYTAGIYFLIILTIKEYITEQKYIYISPIFIIVMFSLVPPCGSNTGLLKISPFLIAILPITLLCCNKILHSKAYLYVFLLVLLSFYVRLTNTYQDAGLYKLIQQNKYSMISKIQYIRTTENRLEFIDNVMSEIQGDMGKPAKILLYGSVSRVFYYLTDLRPMYEQSFAMKVNDENEIRKVETIVSKQNVVVYFLPEYPRSGNKQKGGYLSEFETMLVKNGYEGSNKGHFMIYRVSAAINERTQKLPNL